MLNYFCICFYFYAFCICYKLRKKKNRVFQHTVATPYTLIEKVKLYSFLWLKSKQVSFGYSLHDW